MRKPRLGDDHIQVMSGARLVICSTRFFVRVDCDPNGALANVESSTMPATRSAAISGNCVTNA